jgi:hypothetical protein
MTLPQAADARQGPRVTVSWAARIVVGPQSFLEARVINVSSDGLGLVCERAFQDGSPLHVLIAMPDPADRSKYHYPSVQARVVFHVVKGSKFRLGARFAQMDAHARALIDKWVQQG